MDDYLFKKNANLIQVSEEQKETNINRLVNVSDDLTADAAKKSVWAADQVVKNMEQTGATKLTEEKQVRLRGLSARSSSANLLYTQKGSDSAEMSRIKYYVEGVELLLATNRDKELTGAFLDELDAMMHLASVSCRSYIDNPKKRENDRKRNVRMTYGGLLFEISRIHMLRKDIDAGKLGQKKVSDVFVTVKGKIPAAKYYKQDQAARTIGKDAKKAVGFFSFSFDPYKTLRKVKDKPEEYKKACEGLLNLRNTLRTFSKNRADSAELVLNGKKIIVLQKPDGSLYIVDNRVEHPLDLTVDAVVDRIESEIIEHDENYGKEAVWNIFLDINPNAKDVTPADIQRINNLCVSLIRKKTGGEDNDYGNIPSRLLFKWARGLALGILTPEKVEAEYKAIEENLLSHVNDRVTAEMEEKLNAEQIDATVMIKKEEEAPVEDEEKNWDADESKLINMIADIFFDADTMSADRLTDAHTDDEESMRKRLAKHGDAFKMVVEDPKIMDKLVDRLPLPDIKMMIGGRRTNIKDFMKECFVSVFESDEIKRIKSWHMTGMVVAAFGAPDISFLPQIALEPIKDVLRSITKAMKDMVNKVTDKLQDVAKEIADDTFTENQDPLVAAPDTLEGMLDQLTRGGAAQSRFNKNIMYNYFKDASFMDKRSMMASMVRNAKPEASYVPSDAELIDDLKQQPENRGLFRSGYLTYGERSKLQTYRHKKTQSNVCVSLLGGMLKGAGPLMQKMVQGLPASILPKEMVDAIQDMKSNLNPISENIVKLKMASIVAASGDAISRIEVEKSLGAASIGQAFLCTVYGKKFPEGKKVVIKLLRSDARNRMQREAKLMKKYAKDADATGSVLKSFNGQFKGFMKELDLINEAKNVKDGDAFDGKLPSVTSMKTSDLVSPGADYIMLEVAEGDTVDRYLKKSEEKLDEIKKPFYVQQKIGDKTIVNRRKMEVFMRNRDKVDESINALKNEIQELEKRRDHVLGVCEVTIKEAVVGTGFYHGDLHAGNIMVTDQKATVIDFGNAVRLTKKVSKQITQLSVAAMTSNTALFLESFEAILQEENRNLTLSQQQKDALRTEFQRILVMGTEAKMGERLMVCMLKAQDMGYTIPSSVFNFAQGQMRLMNTVNEMNEKIEKYRNTIDELQKLSFKTGEIPGNADKDYCHVMKNLVKDKTFVAKLATTVGVGALKKLAK